MLISFFKRIVVITGEILIIYCIIYTNVIDKQAIITGLMEDF